MSGGSMSSMTVGTKTSITVQVGILAALIAGVFQAGAIAESFTARLERIEEGQRGIRAVADANTKGQADLSEQISKINDAGTRWATAMLNELAGRVDVLEECASSRHRSCRF